MCVCFKQSLVVDLSEREQQSELARSSHLQNLDYLLELHRSRLAVLELNFSTNLEELGSEYNTERYVYTHKHFECNVVFFSVPNNISWVILFVLNC